MEVADSTRLTLVCGPARGGKSRWAEHLAATSGLQVHYLATAQMRPDDPAWQRRLERHRQRRPAHWPTLSCGAELAAAISAHGPRDLLLIDSLGSWVSWHLGLDDDAWLKQQEALLSALERSAAAVVLVVEETGWGVVPSTAVGGLFRDRIGELSDRLHRRAQSSWLVMHGRAIDLLSQSLPVPP